LAEQYKALLRCGKDTKMTELANLSRDNNVPCFAGVNNAYTATEAALKAAKESGGNGNGNGNGSNRAF